MTNYKLFLSFISKEWYFWGKITLFHFFITIIMMTSFWTWKWLFCTTFGYFALSLPLSYAVVSLRKFKVNSHDGKSFEYWISKMIGTQLQYLNCAQALNFIKSIKET